MRLTTQSEYALVCLRSLSLQPMMKPVSISDISEHETMSKDYVEQLFLKLKRAGIVRSAKGVNGGYFLARSPEEISLKEVIEALEGDIYETFCSPEVREKIVCTHYTRCSIRPIWQRLKELIDDFFSKLTLETILKDEDLVSQELDALKKFSAGALKS